jgi:hypothetical protein
MKPLDLAGKTFHRLTAIRRVENRPGYHQARWLFRCSCGAERVMFGYAVVHGGTKSCGCLQDDIPANLRHGKAGSIEYRTWVQMRRRCLSPTNPAYPSYGGRGIGICDRWSDFAAFYDDMGPRPEGTTLDRRDNDLGYSPDNCRWATKVQQTRNRRTTAFVEFNGETLSMQEWAERVGVAYKTLWYRYQAGKRGAHLFAPTPHGPNTANALPAA